MAGTTYANLDAIKTAYGDGTTADSKDVWKVSDMLFQAENVFLKSKGQDAFVKTLTRRLDQLRFKAGGKVSNYQTLAMKADSAGVEHQQRIDGGLTIDEQNALYTPPGEPAKPSA